MKHIITILLLLSAAFQGRIAAQVAVPIDNYSVNFYGQVQLSIEAESGKYYILEAEHSSSFTWPSSIAMGMNGTMIISEPGAAYPVENYTIWEYDVSNPGDIDGDGIDDVTEFQNMPTVPVRAGA